MHGGSITTHSNKIQREPGTKVLNILPNGDWHMQVMNEDGSTTQELWNGGNPSTSTPWQPSVELKEKQLSHQDGTIHYEDWKLTLPKGNQVLQAFTLDAGTKVLILTTNYDIFEWDLQILRKEIESFYQQ